MDSFEESLEKLTKPRVNDLKHERVLTELIVSSRGRSVLAGWWLSIPLYITAALVMKTMYVEGSGMMDNLHQLKASSGTYWIYMLVIPLGVMILNVRILMFQYRTSAAPSLPSLLGVYWYNTFMILISILLLTLNLI
ncbi:MAG: hypothetical protein JST46_15130 [Bacteroidetes bacterium]|nr:hypothetical protein [Bacteroidota bacterium]